jgi:hypothetical protein
MNRPLLFFAKVLGKVEFVLAAQATKPPDATIHRRNHALFPFKAFACGEIVSGADKSTLRLLQFQNAAQLTRINLPTAIAQSLSHQFVIAYNGVALKEMPLCAGKTGEV